ncbi:transcriptional attenuator, LytR family [Mycolicibacterium chubuense NBB4]|uniref:Transcriptional attenuator, LytR family n=1 Tax=Mycolicibacterium chubuense (strain NBB4) TaxID=710421 RepID=I4BPF7_MYCCN|nr:LCP family protein [Mycolicibacterium chubuense]AFM19164.1 transcriptional attenuator, LytR family [Mycolicibacterium chubuense NBB4]
MSDGDMEDAAATPGRPLPGDQNKPDGDWLTRSRQSAPAAAPWERTIDRSAPVTVADLIAKIHGGAPPSEPKRHRAEPEQDIEPQPAPEPEPAPEQEPEAEPYPADELDTTILPAVDAYSSELPDLAAPRTRQREAEASAGTAPRRARHRSVILGRSVAALVAALALVLTGGAWQWQSAKNNLLNRVSALDPDSRDIVDPNAQFGDENFLIVGVDSRFGDNSEMGVGTTADAAGSRSDTVMLVNIPANRKRVVAVSFPRDLKIEPMKCEVWNPETRQYGPIYDEQTGTMGPDEAYTEYKLNSAFSIGGPKCLVKVIQKMSGLHINRFMAVDFAGFSKMVDALGGVEVCSTTPIEDYELGTVLSKAGRQIVDGRTALNYVRARQVTTETNGDYGRIKRQQLFLSSLLRSLISKDTFFSLSKLNNVVNMFINDSYVDNLTTKDLVDLGQSVQGVNAGRITFVTVPTVGYPDEWGNEIPRTDGLRALFDAIINDDPLPEERNADNTPVPGTPESLANSANGAPAPAPPAPSDGQIIDAVATSPGEVTVKVSNSTGESGLAATAADALETHGFNVTSPDDYPGPLEHTTVFFSPGNEKAAATVASSFPEPTIERATGLGDAVQVVLGSDFHSVVPPSPSGATVKVHVLRGTKNTHTALPEDLTVTNAADTTCE